MKKEPGKERLNKNKMSETDQYDVYREINRIGEVLGAYSKTKLTNEERDDLDYGALLFGMKMQLKEQTRRASILYKMGLIVNQEQKRFD